MVIRPARCALAAVTLLVLTGAAACADSPAGSDPARIDVVAGFYPLQFVAERVGGDAVRVTNLAKPGAEPHDLELTPRGLGQLVESELVIYLKGFQPALDEAVGQLDEQRVFDVTTVQPLLARTAAEHRHDGEPRDEPTGGPDPHLWLDPARLATVAERLVDRLGEIDPPRAADYTARARALHAELTALDQEFQQGLRHCQRREILVSHAAFGYLAERYQLTQVAVTGLNPEDEPAPHRLAEAIREARAHGATTIFFEPLVSPKVAETIAHEVGARTAVLDPVEGLPADSTSSDYFTVMRSNLSALKTALGCS